MKRVGGSRTKGIMMRLCMWNVARVALVLTMGLTLLGGCANRTKAERDALWAQNQELQDELNRSRAALDSQQAIEAARQAELERMRQQQAMLAQQQAPPAQPARPAGGAEDFAGIEGVDATMRGRNIEVTVASDVLFSPGKADLSSNARQTLSRVAGVLRKEYANNRIVIEGHTDTDPIRKSKWPSNQALSEARAEAVSAYLAQQGVPRSRMQTVGFGESQPAETKAKSRRVEIVVQQ